MKQNFIIFLCCGDTTIWRFNFAMLSFVVNSPPPPPFFDVTFFTSIYIYVLELSESKQRGFSLVESYNSFFPLYDNLAWQMFSVVCFCFSQDPRKLTSFHKSIDLRFYSDSCYF